MKILTTTAGWATTRQFILDNGKADAAYEALIGAMADYDRFSNDKSKTVSIDTGDGLATYRLEHLTSASIEDLAASETAIIEREVWSRQIEAKITARLTPA